MQYTVSLTKNRDFRRLYNSGRYAVNQYLAVYCRKSKFPATRLGITVGTKIGNAVIRNRVRRLIRESWRLNEDKLLRGFDVVIVARTRSAGTNLHIIEPAVCSLCAKLGVMEEKKK